MSACEKAHAERHAVIAAVPDLSWRVRVTLALIGFLLVFGGFVALGVWMDQAMGTARDWREVGTR